MTLRNRAWGKKKELAPVHRFIVQQISHGTLIKTEPELRSSHFASSYICTSKGSHLLRPYSWTLQILSVIPLVDLLQVEFTCSSTAIQPIIFEIIFEEK